MGRLRFGFGSGPHVVGWLNSTMRVIASFQIIAGLVGRLWSGGFTSLTLWFLYVFYYIALTTAGEVLILPPYVSIVYNYVTAPRRGYAIDRCRLSVCLSVCLSVNSNYWNGNEPILLKLGVMTGPTNRKSWLTFDGAVFPDTDHFSVFLTIAE